MFTIKSPLLHQYLPLHAKWKPNKPALVDEEKTLTWQQLNNKSNQVANALLANGLKKGESVAILMGNCVEYAEIMYGILKAGGVIVPLNVAVPAEGLNNMLLDAAVNTLFIDSNYIATVEKINALGTKPNHVFIFSGKGDGYEDWRDRQSFEPCQVIVEEDDPVNIIYSSGTTGIPKGIKHAARNRCDAIKEVCVGHRYHEAAISICPIGLYSNIAWASLLTALVVGGTCIIQRTFDIPRWLDAIERFGVTHTMMVPVMFQRVIEHSEFSSQKVASLQTVVSGGSPLYAELKQRVTALFKCAVIELYGLTEGFMTCLQPEEAEGRLASVGKPMGGGDYIILDNDDKVLPWGEPGEICVRSVHWMVEYHNRPDLTAEVMFVDEQGIQWLRTGDIGRADKDGYLYIVDRKKDMILSGGQNIYPADIENEFIKHPNVSEVTVIGVPDEQWGEAPMALIVQVSDQAVSTEDLLAWINERVGKRQRVKHLAFRDDLPRNPNGKVLKRELRELYAN